MPDAPTSLQNLHDIVVPDEIPWWPPAPAWIALLVLALVILLVLAQRTFKNWRANAYRRAALRELAAARSTAAVAEILRRTALAIAPRETIAGLQGKAWTDWLAARSPEPVPDDLEVMLREAIYQVPDRSNSFEPLRDFARTWITRHTRPC